ncbi:TRAFs-binding domain-containing protein [Erythrobacter crassostreae]|uniref:DUF4071 domain-containing protein n=1 Tax=Erythrobacter crassostreae TaxID=2828328 RepID=A0A9X1JNC5_9SPHN|nr:TRAFs-binding domain-containing protein [Erythrobacter crassostrea]MBV7260319.1 DUF4071 domain-containing protein [Erythrobacter crassostrea]
MQKHSTILRIARAGNPARALRLFRGQGLDQHKDDPKLLTLNGRLLKDHARLATVPERHDLYQKALAAYLAAFECERDTYPLINAASLAMFAGDAEQSRTHAQQTLDMLNADPDEGETPYWREATRAEALLLLGNHAQAKTALSAGIAKQPLAHEDLAATIGQFERIIAAQHGDAKWLDGYRPPASIHFSGLIGLDPNAFGLHEAIDEAIAALRPGYAFGALAAGADIMIAEAAVAAGAQLHVTLPMAIGEFRKTSVEPFGENWTARFDALLNQAAQVDVLADYLLPDTCPFALRIELASLISMGQCLRQSFVLRSQSHALTIAAPGEAERPHIEKWLSANRSMMRIETPRLGKNPNSAENQLDMQLIGLAFAVGCELTTLTSIAQDYGARVIVHPDGCLFNVPLENCLNFARKCLQAFPTCDIGMAITVTDNSAPMRSVIEMVELLAKTAEPGQLHVDRMTAFVAKTLDQEIKTEEIGEIPSLYGAISLWQARF